MSDISRECMEANAARMRGELELALGGGWIVERHGDVVAFGLEDEWQPVYTVAPHDAMEWVWTGPFGREVIGGFAGDAAAYISDELTGGTQ